MESKNQEHLKFISKQNQKIGKDRVHSLSPNFRPPSSKNNNKQNNNMNLASNNNIYKNKNLVYNNNINNNQFQNYNIKVNKSKEIQKEKVIEGDLNFNFNNSIKSNQKPNNNINNNQAPVNKAKVKNSRGMPRKSPISVNNSNLKNKNIFLNPLLNKPKIAFGNKNIMNNNNRPPTSNKSKMKINRNQTPLLRTNENSNKIVALNKNLLKPRYISKSPVLGKNSIYNKYKNYGFNNKNINNNKNVMKSQNFKKAKINNPQNNQLNQNNFNNLNNNQSKQLKKINNVANNNKPNQPKRQTIMTYEFVQENNKNEPKAPVNMNKDNLLENFNNNNNNFINKNSNMNGNNFVNNNEIKQNHQNINVQNNIPRPSSKSPQENNISNLNPMENNPKQIANNLNLNKNIPGNEEGSNTNRKERDSLMDVDNKKKDIQNENNLELKMEQKPIQKIPQQPFLKKIKDLTVFTHVGFDGEQDKENNQDNYFIQKNFAGHKDYIYMSVCDGHGTNGHFVSNFIKTILPIDMSENLKHRNILTETEKTHEIIKETFIIANDKLVENPNIDSIFSGTTCVSVIYTPEKLICPNIGDSRAVLARYDPSKNKYIAIELTRDHKPTEPDEKQRILENDGRIQPFLEDGEFVGPERIWIKEEEVPGLAMTRSFGDRVAATVGVISEPEIKEMELNENDKFMIIASDGIWEFISSQECIDIISNFYEKNDIKGCCQFLYDESSKRWIKEEEVIDDTTLILVFFE